MYRILAALAALATAALTALALALPATASVLPHVHVVGNGSAGYSTSSGNGYRNVGVTLTPRAAALNIGGVGQGGMGAQLCDPNNGFGLQLGETSNGHTFTVEYAAGTLQGANADNCVGNGLLANPAQLHPTTLSGLPTNDPIQLFISFRNVHALVRHPGHWTSCTRHGVFVAHCHWHRHFFTRQTQGRAKFQAFDTAGFEVYSSGWIHTAADWNLDEAGAGIQQDTTGMSADTPLTAVGGVAPYDGVSGPTKTGAHNLVADFGSVFVNGTGLGGIGLPFSLFNTSEVATSAGGLLANPAIVAPNGSGGVNPTGFSVWAGNPTV